MAFVEPIIVVLGPWAGGTSAVAGVLHHLGVFMGRSFDMLLSDPPDTWEDARLGALCRRAFSGPDARLRMDADSLRESLRGWADEHRQAARAAGRPPGVKVPAPCAAVDLIRDAWGPVIPVVVDRPVTNVVSSLNRRGWWRDEQERREAVEHLLSMRDLALAGTATVRVDFEELRADPEAVIRRLATDLHLTVTEAQTAAAVQSIAERARRGTAGKIDSAVSRETVCLNMIVKDEAQVIEKCLTSVKPLIDYWVIVDTGSSDDTKQIIQSTMAGIPGELHERPWVNFAHNRNEALEFARGKGDYVLLIDADEVLQYSDGFMLPRLEKDLYHIPVRQAGTQVKRNGLINNHLDWRWRGVIHETVSCPDAKTSEVLTGIVNVCNTHADRTSGRSKDSDVVKYRRDAEALQKALEQEPDNSRYMYYLGISYSAAGEFELAKASFEKRAAMPSPDAEETYLALYNLASTQLQLNEIDAARKTLYRANALRPARAEPLLQLARIYRRENNVLLGYLLSKYALSLPYPADDFSVEYIVYDHTLLIEFANCALLLEKFDEGFDACGKLLANPNLPSEFNPQVQSNYDLARSKLGAGNSGPIFIGGVQRSGTTLMRVLLDSHPRICCGPELMVLPVVAEHYKFLTGRNRQVMESYHNTLSDVQRYCRTFIEGLVANFRRAQGKPRWAEKTPQNMLYMVTLGEIFPDAKFITMVRDGRDVACSLLTMDWTDQVTGQKLDYVDAMAGAARYWRDGVLRARNLAAHPGLAGRVLEVRYEALVTDPTATMRRVLAFLGEQWDDAVLSHHTKDRRNEPVEPSTAQISEPVNQAAVHRWQRDMTDADKAAFKAEAGELLVELGYAEGDW